MSGRAGLAALFVLAGLAPAGAASPRAARIDACDRLTATVIRATGASLAGRAGPIAVFRATDAERMSLDCGTPRMVFAARDRVPTPGFSVLIGRAARALAGADAEAATVLALRVQQASLLAGEPREAVAGGAALRCESGPRSDALAGDRTVCVLAPDRPRPLRRKAGLSRAPAAG